MPTDSSSSSGSSADHTRRMEARARIARIYANRMHPYFRRDDPRHDAAVEEVRRLFEAAYA